MSSAKWWPFCSGQFICPLYMWSFDSYWKLLSKQEEKIAFTNSASWHSYLGHDSGLVTRGPIVAELSVCLTFYNLYCTEFFKGNIIVYLHFLSVLNPERALVDWSSSLWKTRIRLFCIVNTMAADDLVMQGARASAAMVLTPDIMGQSGFRTRGPSQFKDVVLAV